MTEKRIIEHIAEVGERVRKIDERGKQLSSEIEERQAEKARLVLERDREVYLIKDLETLLDDKAREKSWSAQQRPKREGDPLSIPSLIQQVLEKYPDGLQVPALYAEVRKIGFQSAAKKPIGVLNSVLHARTDLFSRRKIARGVLWFLKKYEHVLPAESASVKLEYALDNTVKEESTPSPVPGVRPPRPPQLRSVTK